MKALKIIFAFLVVFNASAQLDIPQIVTQSQTLPYIVVLGIAQDGGYPHAGCHKDCCNRFYAGKTKRHYVSSLALIDPVSHQRWLFDATPDFIPQLHYLDSIAPQGEELFDGIFLTHAHIGHYTGLMYLGKEAMNTVHVPVYAMPGMKKFLNDNGPWSQLVSLGNITLKSLKEDSTVKLNENMTVTPFLVPHRSEYSETVGFRISSSNSKVIYIPDINKWEIWKHNILEVIRENDIVIIDGTFYREGELSNVMMSKVPHPFIEESMKKFSALTAADKAKVYFIHFNHTNPAIYGDTAVIRKIEKEGFHLASEGMEFEM